MVQQKVVFEIGSTWKYRSSYRAATHQETLTSSYWTLLPVLRQENAHAGPKQLPGVWKIVCFSFNTKNEMRRNNIFGKHVIYCNMK